MMCSPGLSSWMEEVSSPMPHRSKPQAAGLARSSFGMVIAQSCGRTSICALLARLTGSTEGNLRQRLREWTDAAPDQVGARRQALDVRTCFAPLLGWVLAWWDAAARRVARVLDAATVSQRFTIWCVAVVSRKCARPIAWVIVPATGKGNWQSHWEGLLPLLDAVIPTDWIGIGLADRGLDAKWLYQAMVNQGWHPFLRITVGGNSRPRGKARFRPLKCVVTQGGAPWAGAVTCCSSPEAQLACTWLARWDDGHTDAWVIVTDRAAAHADVVWYGLRPGIACGLKDTKRGGWHWEQTNMTDPARAARRWLAIAAATRWVVSVGGHAAGRGSAAMLDDLPPSALLQQRTTQRSRPRLVRCVRRGILVILTTLIRGRALPRGQLIPEPWPKSLDNHDILPVRSKAHQKAA